jgi:hypothetical protein
VAWISEATTPAQILVRSRTDTGAWGTIDSASTAPVWHSTYFGVNIDQGPSLLIGPDGVRHLVYIEDYDRSNDYGRVHYVSNTGSGWNDTPLRAYSHDAALALNSANQLYIIGHGHPLNSACKSLDTLCTIKSNGSTWAEPQLFASPPAGSSFDSSPSVKWSVVGFNRPETIEFLFFMTPYSQPVIYYGRLP